MKSLTVLLVALVVAALLAVHVGIVLTCWHAIPGPWYVKWHVCVR